MFYISASLFRKLLFFSAQKGIEANDLLERANIDTSILAGTDEKIPLEIYYSILDAAVEMTGDNYFGLHMGENADPSDISILGFIIASCRTIGEALRKIGRYFAVICSTQRLTLFVEQDNARLQWEMIRHFPKMCIKHCIDLGLANTYNMLRNIACEPVEVKEVWLKAGRPEDISEYERIFKCPIKFDQPAAALIFPPKALDIHLVHSNPGLLSLLEHYANSFLSKIDEEDHFSREISIRFFESIQGNNPTIDEMTKNLGISTRVLQNKLRGEGVTFRKLVNNIRQEISKSYLAENRYTVEDIAYLIGFSEPRTFRRAFKRWTGMTASQYRLISEAGIKNKHLNS
jgi:AraC-like DNA-binding protein